MLLKIVTAVEEGELAPPRISGTVGRFLREYGLLRTRVRELVPHDGSFMRGRTVGEIDVTPLAPLFERLESELLGEVASAIAFSEELAGPLNVTLWGKARPANRLRTIWLRHPSTVHLAGDFRWFAPRRITPGAASVEEAADSRSLWDARCLKFMADEFLAAPPAVAYRWDTAFGPPDFRAFRVVALYQVSGQWALLPSSKERLARPVVASATATTTSALAGVSDLALALLVRDPWESPWSIADAKPIDGIDALAHMITWADLRRELLEESSPTTQELRTFETVLSSIGYRTARDDGLSLANLHRAVSPTAKPIAAWARGVA